MAEIEKWVEAALECSGELAEAVAEVFARFAPNGVVINSQTAFNDEAFEQQPTGLMRVAAYLPLDEGFDAKLLRLEEALWHLGQIAPIAKLELQTIQNQDWMAQWKTHYQPLEIGQKWLILPAWLQADSAQSRTIIRIDPAMAFGTGTHPSTQLCLLAMETYLHAGQEVIDLGCGSGILSIGALRAGAAHALAVDTDVQSVQATTANAALNGISTSLEVAQGSLQQILEGKFSRRDAPLVLANILAPILIRLLGEGLADLVQAGGTLVLSGILDTQAADVLNAAEQRGLRLSRRYQIEDWVGLVLHKQA